MTQKEAVEKIIKEGFVAVNRDNYIAGGSHKEVAKTIAMFINPFIIEQADNKWVVRYETTKHDTLDEAVDFIIKQLKEI